LYTALKALIDMDPELYNKCEQEYEQSCRSRAHDAEERVARWQIIQGKANKVHPNNIDETAIQVDVIEESVPQPTNGETASEKKVEEEEMEVDSVGQSIPIRMEGIPELEEDKGHSAGGDGTEEDVDMSLDPVPTSTTPPA
jgi:hypothetical protein